MRSRNLCVLTVLAVCVLVATSAQATYIGVVAADNPFLLYQLNETGATHATVAHNSGSTGIGGYYYLYAGTGGSFTDVTSPVGIGKQFNPVNSTEGPIVTIAAQGATYGSLSAFTIETLIRPTDVTNLQAIAMSSGQDTGTYYLQLGSGKVSLGVFGDTAEASFDASALPLNVWSHLAATYTASGGSANVKFYVDGTLLNPGGTVLDTGTPANFNQDAQLGNWQVAARQFSGALADFAVYGTALSASQIAAHAEAAGFAAPEPSTLALLATGLIGLLCYAWRKRQ